MKRVRAKSEPVINGTKKCTRCRTVRPVEDFDLHKMGIGGYNAHCKFCRRVIANNYKKGIKTPSLIIHDKCNKKNVGFVSIPGFEMYLVNKDCLVKGKISGEGMVCEDVIKLMNDEGIKEFTRFDLERIYKEEKAKNDEMQKELNRKHRGVWM